MSIDISRHRELFNTEKFNTPVHVIGAGATGSWAGIMLAKLGVKNVTFYDFDIVEEHNIANQAYMRNDLTMAKTSALRRMIGLVSDDEYDSYKFKEEKVTGRSRLDGVVFILTDTMSSRKEIYEKAVKLKPNVDLLIETRMGLSDGRIYTVEPLKLKQLENYDKTFYSDDEAVVSACGTSQSIVTSALTIASMAVRQMINWHNGVELNNEILLDLENNNIYTTRWE